MKQVPRTLRFKLQGEQYEIDKSRKAVFYYLVIKTGLINVNSNCPVDEAIDKLMETATDFRFVGSLNDIVSPATWKEVKHELLWDIPDEGFDLKEVLRSRGYGKELENGWEPSSIERLWKEAKDDLEMGEYAIVEKAFDEMCTTSREKLYLLLYDSNWYNNEAEEYSDYEYIIIEALREEALSKCM